MNDFEELHARLVPYIAERSGLSYNAIEMVLEWQAKFWEERPTLLNDALGEGED